MILLLIIILCSILLVISFYYSIVFSRTDINEAFELTSSEERYIYGSKNTKLYAGFDIFENCRQIAVLYYGYGINSELLNELKNFYFSNRYSVICICADSFYKSEGKKKCHDLQLSNDLTLWLHYIAQMFGDNISIILHGFESTALSCMLLDISKFKFINLLVLHNTHIKPPYFLKHIDSKFSRWLFNKKSQVYLPVINIPVCIISKNELKKDAYIAYAKCSDYRSLYIFEKFSSEEYIENLKKFIARSKPPEVSA